MTIMTEQAVKKPAPLVCPKCGNIDMDDMQLILIDLSWERYQFVELEDGFPVFTWSKSVYSETSNDHDPRIECTRRISPEGEPYKACDGEWDIKWENFDLS